MSAQIIAFAPAARPSQAPLPRAIPIGNGEDSAAECSSTTANTAARAARKGAWQRAEIVRVYYESLHEFVTWQGIAQGRGVGVALSLPHLVERVDALGALHDATRTLLLTPAPDQAALSWKLQRLHRKANPEWALGSAPRAEVERAIAADREFLKAHPVRSGRQRGAAS